MGEAGDVDGETAAAEDGRRALPLVAWAVASFHVALLVTVAVILLYAAGTLGDLLGGLDTWVGVVAYLYLWGITWWTNRRWLDELWPGLLYGRADLGDVLGGAMRWGGVAGASTFLPPVIVVIAVFVGAGGLAAVPFLLVGTVLGLAVSFAVGAVVGSILALVDLLLLSASGSWLPLRARSDDGRGSTETN